MSKRRNEGRSVSAIEEAVQNENGATKTRKSLWICVGFGVMVLLTAGVFAKNGWLPVTDALTGKKTGWFGKQLPKNASSSWNPVAAILPTSDPAPQLSKEYIYAGSRLLAVEDANANAAPPADLAVWRPSTGGWWVLGGQGSQQVTQNWGTSFDQPVQGDYDGDGKTDFAVWRKTESSAGAGDVGNWYIINSSTSTTIQYPFGTTGDVPAQADFDGDGKTDIALFRPSNGNWYIDPSASPTNIQTAFGLSSDTIAPADYDGDGRADLGVWRSSTQTFYSLNSIDGFQTVGLGRTGDRVVSSDYDGDGKADYAVFDSSNANWHIRQSSTGQVAPAIQWGLANDMPVQNDYDGDGKTDVATWRNSNGTWYINQSASGTLRQVGWGIPGDIPVAAFYRR
jgi:hypothetical protein